MDADKLVAAASKAYRDNPTKANGVLHAVAVWRRGCTATLGECEECNDLLLKVLSERLSLPYTGEPKDPERA